MASEAFEKAVKLTEQNPLPDDIFEQMALLKFQLDIDEHDNFATLYEGLYIQHEELIEREDY